MDKATGAKRTPPAFHVVDIVSLLPDRDNADVVGFWKPRKGLYFDMIVCIKLDTPIGCSFALDVNEFKRCSDINSNCRHAHFHQRGFKIAFTIEPNTSTNNGKWELTTIELRRVEVDWTKGDITVKRYYL